MRSSAVRRGRGASPHRPACDGPAMLMAIIAILVILWLIGLVTNVVGALIHIVLAVALVVLAVQFLNGRRRV